MVAELVLSEEAEQDIAEAAAWYERQRQGLGEDFMTRVDACFNALCRTPEMHQLVKRNFRRGLVRRFPYAVFYEYTDEKVIVYGVLHTSQDPKKWRERLS